MRNYGIFFSYAALATIAVAFINLVACGDASSTANPSPGNGGGGSSAIPTSGAGGSNPDITGGTEGPSTFIDSGTRDGSAGVSVGSGGAGGSASVTGGVGGSIPDVFDSGPADGSSGATTGTSGAGGSTDALNIITGTEPVAAGCAGLKFPQVTDYEVLAPNGPFATIEVENTGPGGAYTMFRPANLDDSGVSLHPIATWGNGITTVPQTYSPLLSTFASHGFVLIASNSSTVTAMDMTSGLDWLIQQNTAGGEFQGKLATQCALSIGYSLGGGAAVSTGAHASVVATISFHGLTGAAGALHGPLFLLTSTDDGFVTKAANVVPTYNASLTQPTVMATYYSSDPPSMTGHIRPVNSAGDERAPALAWARLWIYGDSGAKKYFFGADCILAQPPWTDLQRKNYNW
jgi:hypothetical protein